MVFHSWRRLFLFPLAAALLSATALTQPSAPRLPFAPGETLTYDIKWSVFPAGQVVASLKKLPEGAKDAYEVDTTARSQGFVSLLYKIDNHYQSVFDPKTLCSREISKTINEGRRHKRTQIIFDATRRLALLSERDLSKPADPLKRATHAIPPCVEDIVTSFYVLRRAPLHVGEKITVPVNDGSKTQNVIVNVQDREQINTALGPRYAFRIEPHALGKLAKKGRMLIWISDDKQRLPLRIEAMMLIGTISGNLVSVTHTNPVAPAGAGD